MGIVRQTIRHGSWAHLAAILVVLLATASHLRAQDRSAVILPATSSGRLALVIGIDAYDNVTPLQKAVNDAKSVSDTLLRIGFEVTRIIDADRRTLNQAISQVASQIRPGDEVVFYFAGHGIEVNGRNYLLPADVPAARPGDESFVTSESIAADRVLGAFRERGARVTLLILDACRNNPFPGEGQRSLGGSRGLARMDAPEGSFILFSAGSGQTALDRLANSDPDPNSVFTRALLPRLREQGLSIHDLVRAVRTDVRALAGTVQHNQFPAYYDQLSGDFSFNPGSRVEDSVEPVTIVPQEAVQPQAVAPPSDPCTAARADWQVLDSSESSAALQAFIGKYPDCPIFVAAAQDRLAVLQNARAAPAPEPEPAPAAEPSPPSPLTSGDICTRLWYERNLIFHNRGFCFSSARARSVFDTSRCTTRSPVLTAAEEREVARLKAAEQANGC
ncbi:caspase family protein [Vannielia litorea]|uniref:YARHG domain-containing protein n=1 Tax=Vannielia litorea TaxID=1217970 RepID=A0A1N6FLH8_9RHOB|nr:caspase family protein [Vannielia litorea]SIN96118.1 YARHG domain-containing protein [Vannielia litorea]